MHLPVQAMPKSSADLTIVSDMDILGGMPVIAGTRVPAATILASLEDGLSEAEILADYPSNSWLGIEAVRLWAATQPQNVQTRR